MWLESGSPLLLPELAALWGQVPLAVEKDFGYSGPRWDFSYLVNLVAPVGGLPLIYLWLYLSPVINNS
jgi:hypothetical protein